MESPVQGLRPLRDRSTAAGGVRHHRGAIILLGKFQVDVEWHARAQNRGGWTGDIFGQYAADVAAVLPEFGGPQNCWAMTILANRNHS